jgi:hypothetical protein
MPGEVPPMQPAGASLLSRLRWPAVTHAGVNAEGRVAGGVTGPI